MLTIKKKEQYPLCLFTLDELMSFGPGTTFRCVEGTKANLYMIVSGGSKFDKEIVSLGSGRGEIFIKRPKDGRFVYNDGDLYLSECRVYRLVDGEIEINDVE